MALKRLTQERKDLAIKTWYGHNNTPPYNQYELFGFLYRQATHRDDLTFLLLLTDKQEREIFNLF